MKIEDLRNEKFIEAVMPYCENLKPEDAKYMYNVLIRNFSTDYDCESKKLPYLNVRYGFAKKARVPEEIEDLLTWLESYSPNTQNWNDLLKSLDIIWRTYELEKT